MLAVLIIVAILAAGGAVVLAGLGRSRRFNDIDRFHRASAMTTEWARQGVTRPVIAEESLLDGEDSNHRGSSA